MNNYSKVQKILHQIALSSRLLREISFDLEKIVFFDEKFKLSDNHVFISGLARSGTTILLNAVYETKQFASLTYQDMPFILSPNFWSKLSLKNFVFTKQERAHKDGIKIDINSAEAFEEVFWMTFDYKKAETFFEFNAFIQLLCMKYNKKRYLSKNNQNIHKIDFLIKNYPNSKILIPFREPLQHAFSLLHQHKRFIYLQKKDDFIRKYMSWIGHIEFGIDYVHDTYDNIIYDNTYELNHWIEQWYLSYNALKKFKNSKNIYFISYEKLCTDNLVFRSILDFLNVDSKLNFDFQESKKEINISFDAELYDKSVSIYKELNDR